jgi:hypothetical protein
MILFFLFMYPFPSLRAETAEAGAPLPPELGAGAPREELREILERSMGRRQKTWGIRFKESKRESPSQMKISWVEFFQRAGAWILRGLLVLFIAALVLAAAIYACRRRGPALPRGPPSLSRRESAEAPSPPALLEEARRLYRQGLFRNAWSLCYAASLGAFKLRWGLRFPPGATEYRCLALVRRWAGQGRLGPEEPAGRPVEAVFAGFIRHWVAFFYGGILPPEGALEDALAWVESLCGTPAPVKKPASGGGAGGNHG